MNSNTNNSTSGSSGSRNQSPIPHKTNAQPNHTNTANTAKPIPNTNTNPKPKLSEYENSILNDMLDQSPGVTWDDIAGLATAKQILQEAVVLPNLRPDLFTGRWVYRV